MAAEAGLTGLAAFGLVYATVLRRGAEAIARAPDPATWAAAAGAWAGVIGFLVGGLTQYTFGDAEVAIAMWVALAILARLAEDGGCACCTSIRSAPGAAAGSRSWPSSAPSPRAATPRPWRRTRRGRWRAPPPRPARGSSRPASPTPSPGPPRWASAPRRP